MQSKKLLLKAIVFITAINFTYSQSHQSTQSHQSMVSAIKELDNTDDNSFVSAGLDGFLVKWEMDGLGEHYQISDLTIQMIARSPNGNEIAVYETDGASINRVSIWNWNTLTRKHTIKFTDSLTSLDYSAKGTYLICGTASVDGAVFINAATGSKVNHKLKESTGVVNFTYTSATENTLFVYSPAGAITYYNLKTGEKKQKFSAQANLENVCMFNNGLFIAGTYNKNLYVIQATSGNTIGVYSAPNAVLLGNNNNKDLYYIINEGRNFKLYKVQNDRNKAVIQPEAIRTFTGLKSNETIVTAAIKDQNIYAGTNKGNIYTFDNAIMARVDSLLPITDNFYDYIYDIASKDDSFYFLTPGDLFLSSYDNGDVISKGKNPGYKNIITYGESVILWTKDSKKSVILLDLVSNTSKTLFTPQAAIQSLRLFGDSLIDIEGNKTVNLFNITTNKKEQLYLGTSLQDAVLYNENDLYVAKSSATNPQVPLLYVNTQTKETVPLSVKGNVAYSLAFDAQIANPEIYGITISQDTNGSLATSIFSFDPERKSSRSLLTIKEEDPDSFIYLSYPALYTNIGKSQVRSYNITNRKELTYKRSASMPLKVCRNKTRVVVLNRDGSISWYNPDMNGVLADWYLTTDGQWFEF